MQPYPTGTQVKITRGRKRGTYTVAGWCPFTNRYILRSQANLPVWAEPSRVKGV